MMHQGATAYFGVFPETKKILQESESLQAFLETLESSVHLKSIIQLSAEQKQAPTSTSGLHCQYGY